MLKDINFRYALEFASGKVSIFLISFSLSPAIMFAQHCARLRGHRLGGSRLRLGLDDHLCPLRWMPERRWPARLRHQDLCSGERLRAVQLLRRSGGLHQVRVDGEKRKENSSVAVGIISFPVSMVPYKRSTRPF